MTGGGLSAEGLQATFAENPAASITLIAACLQPFVAYLLRFVYRHYAQGDTGYAVSNLIALLCAEMLLQNIVGIAGMAVLLWRTWRRGSEGLDAWRAHRGVGGMLVDISGASWCWHSPVSASSRARALACSDGRHLGRASAFGTLAK
mgnify:CR=1 FL=1